MFLAEINELKKSRRNEKAISLKSEVCSLRYAVNSFKKLMNNSELNIENG